MIGLKSIKHFRVKILLQYENEDGSIGDAHHDISICVENKPLAIVEAMAIIQKMFVDKLILPYLQNEAKEWPNATDILDIVGIEHLTNSAVLGPVTFAVPDGVPVDLGVQR